MLKSFLRFIIVFIFCDALLFFLMAMILPVHIVDPIPADSSGFIWINIIILFASFLVASIDRFQCRKKDNNLISSSKSCIAKGRIDSNKS